MQQIQTGDTAKNKAWTWGGRVTQVVGETVHILVGSDETGETYSCPLSECEKKNPQTSQFEPVAGTSDQTEHASDCVCDACRARRFPFGKGI